VDCSAFGLGVGLGVGLAFCGLRRVRAQRRGLGRWESRHMPGRGAVVLVAGAMRERMGGWATKVGDKLRVRATAVGLLILSGAACNKPHSFGTGALCRLSTGVEDGS